MDDFSAKDRLRFRKLLEVANSSTFTGEREAALAAATRLAATHGMTLREAAGMSEPEEPARPRPARKASGFPSDFGAAARAAGLNREARHGRVYGRHGVNPAFTSDAAQLDAEKRRHEAALADAFKRGLDAEERAAAEKARDRLIRKPKKQAFRNRSEFVRVLLKETHMSAREIAATAGVTIYDVYREKLLMRQSPDATAAAG